jgi:hypothetical protein
MAPCGNTQPMGINVESILGKPMGTGKDIGVWQKGKNGKFSVESMYNQLVGDNGGDSFVRIWKAKLRYKIKIFVWLMENNAVLTKDNMIKRKWIGDAKCQLCDDLESVNHLFFKCVIARVIWGVVAQHIGACNIPSHMGQYWAWIQRWMPSATSTHCFV